MRTEKDDTIEQLRRENAYLQRRVAYLEEAFERVSGRHWLDVTNTAFRRQEARREQQERKA